MRFSLDVLRARKGDCLIIHYGSNTDPHLIMIDGGPSDVYKPQLEPRLNVIRKNRQLDDRVDDGQHERQRVPAGRQLL